MEIILTLNAVVEQSRENVVKANLVYPLMEGGTIQIDDSTHLLATSSPERSSNVSSKDSVGHIRSLSSGGSLQETFTQFQVLSPKMRSMSLQSLRLSNDNATSLNQGDLLARMFWVAVSLLESDYEHEFVMAVKLLSKVYNFLYFFRTREIQLFKYVFLHFLTLLHNVKNTLVTSEHACSCHITSLIFSNASWKFSQKT